MEERDLYNEKDETVTGGDLLSEMPDYIGVSHPMETPDQKGQHPGQSR